MSYNELRERVYTFIHDSERSFISESDVDSWIVEGLDDLSTRLPLSHREATGTTSGAVPVPADMVNPISLKVGGNHPAWVDDNVYQGLSGTGQGTDPVARVFNGQIEVYPVPNNTTYTLRYWSLAGDTSLVRGNLKLRLVNYAVSRAKAKEGDYRGSEYYLGLYERGLPAPNDSTINAQQTPDSLTFEPGPFDTVDAGHN